MRSWIVILMLLPSLAFSADNPATAPAVTVPVAPQGFPQPIIFFNYGTYQGGPLPVPLLSAPSAPAAAGQTAALLNVKEIAPDYTNGLGLLLLLTAGDNGPAVGAQIDFRFVDYLGLEIQGMRSLESAKAKLQSGYFFGPKVQIPFKSSLVDLTPTVGLGYGGWDVDGANRKGLALLLRAEIAFADFFTVRGTYLATLSNEGSANYQSAALSHYDDFQDYPSYGSYYNSGIVYEKSQYEALSLSAGFRFSGNFTMGADFTQRRVGGSKAAAKSLFFELKL